MSEEEFNDLWDTCDWRGEIDKLRAQVAELKRLNKVALEAMKITKKCCGESHSLVSLNNAIKELEKP